MEDLKQALKELLVEECEASFTADSLADEEPLIQNSRLDLDSLDILQFCMALKKEYGVRIEGSITARRRLKNINTLAEYIEKNRR